LGDEQEKQGGGYKKRYNCATPGGVCDQGDNEHGDNQGPGAPLSALQAPGQHYKSHPGNGRGGGGTIYYLNGQVGQNLAQVAAQRANGGHRDVPQTI